MRICRAFALLATLQGIGISSAFAPPGTSFRQSSNFARPRVASSTAVPRQDFRPHLRIISNSRAAPHMLVDISSIGGQQASQERHGAAADKGTAALT